MAFSTYTIPIDSRYINGAAFLLFDVIAFNVFVAVLRMSQAALVQRRLREGKRVKIRESRLDAYVGGMLADGTFASRALMIIHVAMLALLFALTLGINGSTQVIQTPATRRYITRLPAHDNEFSRPKRNAQVFSSCVSRVNTSILFYPTAFNTERNILLDDLFLIRDKDGHDVNIDVPNMLCQDFGRISPMLVVRRCGDIPQNCDNIMIQKQAKLLLLPTRDAKRRTKETIFLSKGQGPTHGDGRLLLMHRNVRVQAHVESAKGYNRLLCKERPLQGEENPHNKHYFNCVIGKWNEDESVFNFKLSQVTYDRNVQNWRAVRDGNVSTEVDFFVTSPEIEVEWDAANKGEALFADGLSVLGERLSTGCGYLETVVSTNIIAEEVSRGVEIIVQGERLVTDVTRTALILYGILAVVVASGFLLVWFTLRRSEKDSNLIDVTSFGGLASLLRREVGCKDPLSSKSTEFGITSSERDGKRFYRLEALRGSNEVVPLPSKNRVEV